MKPGGQFVTRGVTPGEYAISAEIGSRFMPDDKRERELAYVPIRVEGADKERKEKRRSDHLRCASGVSLS